MQTEIRPALADYLYGIKGRELVKGIEVGVCDGENAHNVLTNFKNVFLYLVEIDESKADKIKWMLGGFPRRYELILKSSEDAANDFKDELDFVYIDGDHDYEPVKKDIEIWSRFLKPIGSMLSGHDYLNDSCLGVRQAVNEMVLKKKTRLYVQELDWWIYL